MGLIIVVSLKNIMLRTISGICIFVVLDMAMAPVITAAEDHCVLNDPVIQWELDHCFLRSGTDDAEHPLVKACMNLAPESKSYDEAQACSRKIALKQFRCLFLRQNPEFRLNQKDCMRSPDTNGKVVKNDGV